MKSDYTVNLDKLEAKLASLTDGDVNITGLLNKGIDNLLRLDFVYANAEIELKRNIIGSVYPEKMHIRNNSLRTGKVNELVKYIYLINSDIEGNKKGQNRSKSTLSCQVGMTGFEPATPSTPC